MRVSPAASTAVYGVAALRAGRTLVSSAAALLAGVATNSRKPPTGHHHNS